MFVPLLNAYVVKGDIVFISMGQIIPGINLVTLIVKCLTSPPYRLTLILSEFLTSNPFN